MWKEIFIDGQLLGILIGSIISYLINKQSLSNSREIQKDIWKKDFDKHQIEPIIGVFNKILTTLSQNSIVFINKPILQEDINELKIRAHLIRSFDENLRNEINTKIYTACLEYNELRVIKESNTTSSTENELRVEKEKRETIEKEILNVVNMLKDTYTKI